MGKKVDVRTVLRRDPSTVLRAVYIVLGMLDEELGNDTDAMAAVPYLQDAQKAIWEAIKVLEGGETNE